jgi:Glycosyl hydrolase family 26
VSLGVHRGNSPHGPLEVEVFGTWLGKPIETGIAFLGAPTATQGWAHVEGPSWNLDPWRDWLKAKPGRKLSLQVPMMPRDMGVTLAQIAAGQHDSHYITLANNLAARGMLGIELRIGHEMDGKWYPWSAPAGSGKEASFAAAYRRIVNVMRQAQPTNKWVLVWNPTSDNFPVSTGPAYLESIYPGDSYVDQVGSDTYDRSWVNGKVYYPAGSDRLTRQKEVWASHLVRLNILRDFARKHGKPLQFSEWGCMAYTVNPETHIPYSGGDNPYFVEQMHKYIMDPANGVVMHAYFDVNNASANFRIGPPSWNQPNSSFPQAQAKYKQLFGTASH